MTPLPDDIRAHYHRDGLLEEITAKLQESGLDLHSVGRSDIAGVDEFHVRGAEVSRELARESGVNGLEVLDVGCGLGGAARMLADEFHCRVKGIDLSAEYIRTARGLSRLVKLDPLTDFRIGDATDLPFEAGVFDLVWTQHVQMNIPDKRKFYSEITRVLKPAGRLLYYDIFKAGRQEVNYPMPWANTPAHSFLFQAKQMDALLVQLGFRKVSSKDQTEAGIAFFEALLGRLQKEGPPRLGLNLLMGAGTGPKLSNLLRHLQNGSLALQSGIYQKA